MAMPSLEVRLIHFYLNSDVLNRFPVAFHCYAGKFKNQAAFTSKFPDKEVYFTGKIPSCLSSLVN
jgi:O-glycosyl hydrolase